MHRKILAIAFSAATALVAAQAGAQTVYKCRNAAGKITYASQACADLGLRPVGEVKESINVAPAYKAPPRPAEPEPAAAAAAAARATPPNAEEAAKPERRCFKVKTAKGYGTRCNDKPEDDDK